MLADTRDRLWPGQYRLVARGRYIGVDITESDYKDGVPRTPDVVADAAHLSFRDDLFDVVFFSGVFYHFDDPYSALAEAKRVLRPHGHLLMFDYSKKTLERLRTAYTRSCSGVTAHPRTCSQYTELLKDAGFVNILLLPKSMLRRYRLVKWLGWRLLYSVFFSKTDHQEGGIVLLGQKRDR